VITREEADLIGDSRLDKTSLSSVARRIGVPVTTAWCRRKAAETRRRSRTGQGVRVAAANLTTIASAPDV
jgi:hypothetical protein